MNLEVFLRHQTATRFDQTLMREVEVKFDQNEIMCQTPERKQEGLPPFRFGYIRRSGYGAAINRDFNTQLDEETIEFVVAEVNRLMPDESGPHKLGQLTLPPPVDEDDELVDVSEPVDLEELDGDL